MLLISRDTETAAASPPKQITAEKSPVIEHAKADVPDVVATPSSVVETAAPAPSPEPVQVKRVAPHKTSVKKLSAKPRRDASRDPNGTVDPYL